MSEKTSGIDDVIDRAIDENQIVGTDVSIFHRRELIYKRDAGFADREAGTVIGKESIFRLDSLTKAFLSVATERLVALQKLHPDDLVTAWLEEYQPRLESGESAEMRVRHLMTHTSGLGYRAEEGSPGPYTRAGVTDGADLAGISMQENLRRLSTVPLAFVPGTAWKYSIASNLLGEIVGRAHGSNLREAIRDLVTDPLELDSVSFDLDRDQASRLTAQYTDASPLPERMPDQVVPGPGEPGLRRSLDRQFDSTAFAAGGGGLLGSAVDLATFFEAVRISDPRIISPASTARLFENQIGALECDPGWGYSFGWSVLVDRSKDPTPQSVGTISWAGGLGHRWFIDPSRELTVISLTNTSFAGAFGPYPDSIRDAAYRLIESD